MDSASSPLDQKKYSIGEASKFLGVSIDTLRRWEKAGKISALRSPGGHRYFLKANLESAFGQKYSRSIPDTSTDERKTQPEPQLTVQPEPQPIPPQASPPAPSVVATNPPLPKTDLKPTESTQPESTPLKQSPPEGSFYPEKPQTSAQPDRSKKFTVEEIPSTPQNQPPDTPREPETKEIPTQVPQETAIQSLPQTEKGPQSTYLPVSPLAVSKPSEPTKEEPVLQPQKIETSATTESIVTQNQKGSSTLRKLSIFLLIVFLMVNIVLIGFYIFVSNQL